VRPPDAGRSGKGGATSRRPRQTARVDVTEPVDLPATWASEQWRVELEAWLLPTLADAGLTVTGPLERSRTRFWSTVLHVETDAGRVWVKENAPSQAFEACLVDAVERLAPGRMPPVVAVEPGRGWLATRDIGTPLRGRDDVPDEAWTELASAWAGLQHDLAPHADALLGTGLSAVPESGIAQWAAALADELGRLPGEDPRALTDEERRHVAAGLPLVEEAAAVLASSGLPASLEHNDLHLGNAFHAPGAPMQFIDLGDAVWAHPLTAFRIPVWVLSARRRDRADALVRRVVDAALEPWTDRMPRADLEALLPAADRVSCLHRALSWRRLVEDVPLGVVDPEYVRSYAEWLLIATDPDPYTAAVEDRHVR
jgi:hypothetical protein